MKAARKILLPAFLKMTDQGEAAGVLLKGPVAEAQEAFENTENREAIAETLSTAVTRRLITQKTLINRIAELCAVDATAAADFLLEIGLEVAPQSPLFVGERMMRLLASGESNAAIGFAEELTETVPDSLPLLHWALVGMHRAGVAFDDPRMVRAFEQFEATLAKSDGRLLAKARLTRALGFPALAAHLVADQEGAAFAKARSDIAARRDRWLEGATGTEEYQALAAHFKTKKPGIDPAESAGDPLENAFDYVLANQGEAYEPANRLLMVGNSLAGGGMERVLARSYRHFSDNGDFDAVDLALIDYADDDGAGFYREEAGVSCDQIVLLDKSRTPEMPFTLLPGSWKVRAQRLYAHIEETRPAVIHAWNDLTGLLAAYAGLLAGAPKIVIHFHHGPAMPKAGLSETIASYPTVYQQLAAHPAMSLLFCSEQSARDYADWWHMPFGDTFRIVHNGFDWPDEQMAQPGKNTPPVIGTVLRFDPVKQPMVWVSAAIRLAAARADVQFLMVGDGPLRAEVEAAVADAGLVERFEFTGQVSDVRGQYIRMDAFWLTSKSEGLPNVCVEAQLSGVPVIAFDVGGTRETFLPDETGIAVPPNDTAALIAETEALFDDPDRLTAMGEKAAAHSRTHFSAERFFSTLHSVYQSG